jgi:hypothetical protein
LLGRDLSLGAFELGVHFGEALFPGFDELGDVLGGFLGGGDGFVLGFGGGGEFGLLGGDDFLLLGHLGGCGGIGVACGLGGWFRGGGFALELSSSGFKTGLGGGGFGDGFLGLFDAGRSGDFGGFGVFFGLGEVGEVGFELGEFFLLDEHAGVELGGFERGGNFLQHADFIAGRFGGGLCGGEGGFACGGGCLRHL